MVDLQAAYAACERDCRTHYENFPVASFLLPRRMRPHVAALYAFARAADDFADEGDRTVEERYRLIDGWRGRLLEAVAGTTSTIQRSPERGEPAHSREIFMALGVTIRRLQLPSVLLEDLLSAFRQDVTVSRYATWPALFDYCRRSANPIGRLVLRIGGYADNDLDKWSDAICTALQLTNFWQDLAVDWSRGRLYVPEETLRHHGADPSGLAAARMTPEWVAAMHECCARTRALFEAGRAVCDGVRGRLRYELRATWLGGTRILHRLERSGFDVFTRRPSLGTADALVIACGTLLWRAIPPSPTRS